jgi:hypothetical protein
VLQHGREKLRKKNGEERRNETKKERKIWSYTSIPPYVLMAWSLVKYTRVYQKVFGLAAWSENCKWYSSLPLDAVV